MIKCWNQDFENAEELFEHPKCYVRTLHILRKRLQTLPPEEAVMPDCFYFCNTRYETIYKLHHYGCGTVISLSALYKRLGLIVNGEKLTPEQATCPQIWSRLRRCQRVGRFGTVLLP